MVDLTTLSRDERGVILAHELSHAFAALLLGWQDSACLSRPSESSMALSWRADLHEAGAKRIAAIALSGIVTEMMLMGKFNPHIYKSHLVPVRLIEAAIKYEKDIDGFGMFNEGPSDMTLFGAALSGQKRPVFMALYAVEVACISAKAVMNFMIQRRQLFEDILDAVEGLPTDGSMGLTFSPLNLLMKSGRFGMTKTFLVSDLTGVNG